MKERHELSARCEFNDVRLMHGRNAMEKRGSQSELLYILLEYFINRIFLQKWPAYEIISLRNTSMITDFEPLNDVYAHNIHQLFQHFFLLSISISSIAREHSRARPRFENVI